MIENKKRANFLSGATKAENGVMPPTKCTRSGPGPSTVPLPCRTKAQELRSGLSSNSLGFVTIGRAKGLIAFAQNGPDRAHFGGSVVVFLYNPHVLSDTTNIENGKWHYAAPSPDGKWARTGTVDSSIVRFLLPIGGAALLR
jgi:hypothetical protein